jgi:hypothetical protein
MIISGETMVYKAFGLKILSQIPLPELIQVSQPVDKVDIMIETGDLSKSWSELSPCQKTVADINLLMFEIPKTATFSVQKGERIVVSPKEGADPDQIRLFILGTCMGALLLQRKVLPLHGSAVAIEGKAYSFIGDSGAGKSTLASVFLNQGYQLLSDDVIATSLIDDTVFVLPSYPQQKLWQESLQRLGMETEGYCPIIQRETKFAVPVLTKYSSELLPLAGVFELVKTESNDLEVHQIQGLQQLNTLLRHTYRNLLISSFELIEWHFSISTKIVNQIDLFQIKRPACDFTAPRIASVILNVLNKGD